jgi:hypothetical protein
MSPNSIISARAVLARTESACSTEMPALQRCLLYSAASTSEVNSAWPETFGW